MKKARELQECQHDTVTLGSGDGELIVCSDGKVFLGGKLAANDIAFRAIAQTVTERDASLSRACNEFGQRTMLMGACAATVIFFIGYAVRAFYYAGRASYLKRRAAFHDAKAREFRSRGVDITREAP